jgi:hypothetical protein
MDKDASETIKLDFLAWTGGFPPDSEEQIFAYVETSRPNETDYQEVRQLLRAWMYEVPQVDE